MVVPGVILYAVICYIFSDDLSTFIFDSTEYSSILKIMSLGFFFSGMNQVYSSVYWSLSRFKQESSRLVIVGFIKVVMGVVFVIYFGITGLIASLVIGSLINTLIYTFNLRDIIFSRIEFHHSVGTLLRESMPFYMESYLMYFRAEGDQLIVTALLGAEALAIYYIAKKPFEMLRSFTQSFDKILTASLAKQKDDLILYNDKVNQIFTLNAYLIFPPVFILMGLSPTMIDLIAGPDYSRAVVPSMFLLFCLAIQFYWRATLGRSVFLLHSSMGRIKVTLFESLSLIILIFSLGFYYNLMGIVIGRLISTLLAAIFAYFLIRSKLNFDFKIKNVVLALFHSIIMFVLLLIAQYFFTNLFILSFAFIISFSIFLILINRTISDHFYAVLNQFLPVKLIDPVSILTKKLQGIK